LPERPKLMHYAENISYDEFTSIYELPGDTTVWRIFNTGDQTIFWSEFAKPAAKGEKSYHTLLAHSAEVPIIIADQVFVKRSRQNSEPRVEILWTRSKEPEDMARVAGGLYLGKHIVTTLSGRGIEAKMSGETVIAKISGETVTSKISGQTVQVSVISSTLPTMIRTGRAQFDDTTPRIIGSGEIQAVTIKGFSINSGDMFIGFSGATSGDTYMLGPDGTVQTDIDNLNKLYVVAQISGEKICYLANY